MSERKGGRYVGTMPGNDCALWRSGGRVEKAALGSLPGSRSEASMVCFRAATARLRERGDREMNGERENRRKREERRSVGLKPNLIKQTEGGTFTYCQREVVAQTFMNE